MAMLIVAAPASAGTAYPFHHSFPTLGHPGSVATDSDGNVYVADRTENVIQKFDAQGDPASFSALGSPPGSTNLIDGSANGIGDADGTPLGNLELDPPGADASKPQIAADNSGGPRDGWVYVAELRRNTVKAFDSTGAFRGQVNLNKTVPERGDHPCGLAVDNTGDYYVMEGGATLGGVKRGHIDKYHPIDGVPGHDAYVSQLQGVGVCGHIAVSPAGTLYLANAATQGLQEFPATQFSRDPGNPAEGSIIGDDTYDAFFPGPVAVALDPVTGHIFGDRGTEIEQLDAAGNPGGPMGPVNLGEYNFDSDYSYGVAIHGQYVYVSGAQHHGDHPGDVYVFGPSQTVPNVLSGAASNVGHTIATLSGHVDPIGAGTITDCKFEYGVDPFGVSRSYEQSAPCTPAAPLSGPSDVSADLSGLDVEQSYHYRISATNANGTQVGSEKTFTTRYVLDLSTDPATNVTLTSATLNGSFDPNGDSTQYYFEYGIGGYTETIPSFPGADAGSGNGHTAVSANVTGLTPGATYQYRLVATNSLGTSYGPNQSFSASTPPSVASSVTEVKSDGATVLARINPNGAKTTYQVEYGLSSSYGTSVPLAEAVAGAGLSIRIEKVPLAGLQPANTYHYRVVAKNARGVTTGPDRTFRTFGLLASLTDPCPNALARQQTGAALLLDCRAYELVSASDTNGYNVESDLVPGETPYGGYPLASSPPRVLYAVHSGAISGPWNPTNLGPDPYLATRSADGWVTAYAGIDAAASPSTERFSSSLGEANPTLGTFAFAGEGLCSPCFSDGKTGIPVRMADGSLVQGMAGSLDPGPGAAADLLVRKRLSVDGRYLIFGSTSQFEPDAPSGQPAIYRRDLSTETTQVISKTPGGANIACLTDCATKGVAGLDLSDDGSRVVIGQLISTDAAGNDHFHPYMNQNGASSTIDLAPGSSSGVLWAGMLPDGTKAFFTTVDPLTPDDLDTSADLFAAEVSGAVATLSKLSNGNTDACDPVANIAGSHWNSVDATASCDTLAIAGGGGVASEDGSAYFLSPELLDGSLGVVDRPNLYLVRPGVGPKFIATLDPNDPLVLHALSAAGVANTADFQVAPSGDDAVFVSSLPLTGYPNEGHSEAFRYHAPTDQLDCVSCAPTGAEATADAALARNGRSITDDGRVFFTTPEQLVLRDTNQQKDVYEWEEGEIQLISSGASPTDSGLLSVSADGTDAYFFTRERLVAADENGVLMKIYDARERGGFFVTPPSPPCAASDECHGPGTTIPTPPQIGTFKGSGGNHRTTPKARRCRNGKIRRHGRCVKARHRHRSERGRR